MKNFIFAMCGFLMMSLVSLSVQASSVESSKCEYVNPSVDVGARYSVYHFGNGSG